MMEWKKSKVGVRLLLSVLAVTFFWAGCSPIGIEALEDGEVSWFSEMDTSEIREKADQAGETIKQGAGEAAEKAKEGAKWAAQEGKEIGDAAAARVAKAWLTTCLYLRGWAPFIIVGSLLIGYILTEVFPKNAEIRKFAVVTMCVRVPFLTLLVTYGALLSYRTVAGRNAILTEMAAKVAMPCVLWYEVAAPLKWVAAILCVASIALGLVLAERFRKNPDVAKTAKSYLIVRIPMVTFLTFIVYPFLYFMFS